MVLTKPTLWVQNPYGPFTKDLDLMILLGPFQFKLFYEKKVQLKSVVCKTGLILRYLTSLVYVFIQK